MSANAATPVLTSEQLRDPKAPHNKALSKAKIQIMSKTDSVFFTTLCFSLKHVWDTAIPTAATDGLQIRYNPNFFMSLNVQEQVFLMIHEAMHCAYLHMLRRGGRDPKKWNYACDFVINAQLIERGYKMPNGGLYDPKYAGMSADQVYNVLPTPPQSQGGFAMMDLDESGQGGPGKPDQPGQGQGEGVTVKGSGKTPAEIQREIEDILVRAQLQAKMAGNSPGAIPGDIQIFLNKLLDPKLPWNRILAKYLNKYSKNDYSWKKPSRRFFPTHYLPSLYSEFLMDLAFAVDTSGSVSDKDFHRFISEVNGVMRMMKPEKLTLIQFDTEIKSVDQVKSLNDLANVKFTGRGGTDVSPVIEWANKNKPQVLLIFTDGEFGIPSFDCKSDLVWLIHNNPRFTYPQGKVIHYEIE